MSKSAMDICDHGVTTLDLNLEYANDFMRLYKETGFFAMNHLKVYTHNDDLNNIRWLDNSLLKFFQSFKADTDLSSSTILIIFSDHGQRFAATRKKIQGLLEERNPFFSIFLPRLFRERYPVEYNNVKRNAENKLIAPMDIHATFMDLIDLQRGVSNQGKVSF
jgi:phosphoglycerol transferase MdoB-like AlkP superfamily enzyme